MMLRFILKDDDEDDAKYTYAAVVEVYIVGSLVVVNVTMTMTTTDLDGVVYQLVSQDDEGHGDASTNAITHIPISAYYSHIRLSNLGINSLMV
jgi:hypothetical protein